MPAKSSQTDSGGFSAEERAAMKERAAELRAEGKKSAKKADELRASLDGIAKMALGDCALAERVHPDGDRHRSGAVGGGFRADVTQLRCDPHARHRPVRVVKASSVSGAPRRRKRQFVAAALLDFVVGA